MLWSGLCLLCEPLTAVDEGVIHIHRQYWEDIMVLGHIREPGDDNGEHCYGA